MPPRLRLTCAEALCARRMDEDLEPIRRQLHRNGSPGNQSEAAHIIHRQIGCYIETGALSVQHGREMTADELHDPDLHGEPIGLLPVESVHHDVLRPKAYCDGCTAIEADCLGNRKGCPPDIDTCFIENPTVEKVHAAHEIGNEGGTRSAVDLGGRPHLLDP